MYVVGLVLVPLWLIVALILLVLDGRLWLYCLVAVPTSVVVLIAVALIRDRVKPSLADRVRYRVADDLNRPLLDVVTEAEAQAHLPVYKLGGGLQRWD